MRSLMIVKVKVAIQRWQYLCPANEVAGVDQLVLQRAPQALDENIVQGAPASIHTDGDAAFFQRRQKLGRGELRTLMRVPDLGLTEAERAFQFGQAEAGLHRVGQFPTEHEPTEPIHNR